MDLYGRYLEELHQKYPDAGYVEPGMSPDEPVKCFVGNPEGKKRPTHYHNYLEFIYVLKDKSTLTVNKEPYDLHAGDLCIILPGEVHENDFDRKCEYACILVNPAFLLKSVFSPEDLRKNLPLVLPCINKTRVMRAGDIEGTVIPELIQNILHEYADNNLFRLFSMRTYLSQITLYVFRKWYEDSISGNKSLTAPGVEKISVVLDRIKTGYHECLTAEDMAVLAGMSYSYFSRYFKRVMGTTFSEYLNSYRITRSLELLENSDLSVSDIAIRVGFTTPSYYIAQFKKQLHATPKKYKSGLAVSG